MSTEVITPVGRLVGGDLYRLFPATDDRGQKKMKADGTPDERCNFGVAIPKGTETHWGFTDWGKLIWDTGCGAFPKESQWPSFAWKIIDGDSQTPNKKGKRPCDTEYYRGHWILWFSQGWLPKLVNADGSVELTQPDLIKPGYFIRVMADVSSNNSNVSPGIYLNPKAVAFMYEGQVIELQGSVDTSGFAGGANAAMPAGATPITPAAAGFSGPTPPGAAGMPPAPTPGAAMPPAPTPGGATVPMTPGVTPAPEFIHPPTSAAPAMPGAPAAPTAPAAPAAPPAAPVHQMTAAANGIPYESFIAQGWTDAQLIQQGFMVG